MENNFLKGRIALITGAYQNLGSVIAEILASFGADIIVNDLPGEENDRRGVELIERLEKPGVRAKKISADLAVASEVKRLCEEAVTTWGKVDILINNAGPFNLKSFLELEAHEWDTIINVNLKAVYLTTKELYPVMKKQGWGRIINLCAGSAYVKNHGVYGLAKAGVRFLTESLALEVGPEVTVNAIAPGQILESLPVIETYDPTFGERYRERSPLKRLITRKEIALLISQLCTDVFKTVTGVTFRADGGAEISRF